MKPYLSSIIIFLSISISFTTSGQTKIGIVGGVDNTTFTDGFFYYRNYAGVKKNGFGFRSLLIGVKGIHNVTEKSKLIFQSTLTKKKMSLEFLRLDHGNSKYNDTDFKYLKNKIGIQRMFSKHWGMEIAWNLNYVIDLEIDGYFYYFEKPNDKRYDHTSFAQELEMGTTVSLIYALKNFEGSISYYHGLPPKYDLYFYTRTIQSINFTIGYFFNIGKTRKK